MNCIDNIAQLENLREYCKRMLSDGGDIWKGDIKALTYAINIIRKNESNQ